MAATSTVRAAPSAWAPLSSPIYRALWIAQFVSNLVDHGMGIQQAADGFRRQQVCLVVFYQDPDQLEILPGIQPDAVAARV